jgi:hypothetical protein
VLGDLHDHPFGDRLEDRSELGRAGGAMEQLTER